MRLWMPVIVTPIVVLAQQSANYALVALECEKQQRFAIHLVSGTSLVIVLSGMLFAWVTWRSAGTESPDDSGQAVSRVRFLAAIGLALSALMALAIVSQWMTAAFVPPCLE
jgi:hypothetical protein